MKMETMVPQKLLIWYDTLYSRTVDLVGDYAGDELFIVDGDSLLLQSFSDEKLDFSPGFQVLHATYLAENLLHKLHRRNCVFHVAFFTENAHLCVPVGVSGEFRYRYLLAREAIIRHLRANIPAAASAIGIKQFASYQSSDFRSYLLTSGAYFFMCHDGAFPESAVTDVMEDNYNESETLSEESDDGEISGEQIVDERIGGRIPQHRIDLRRMIYWFMEHGYNVALINSLEFRDTKIMSIIVERNARAIGKRRSESDLDFAEGVQTDNNDEGISDYDSSPNEEHDTQLQSGDKSAGSSREHTYALLNIADNPTASGKSSWEGQHHEKIDLKHLERILASLKTIRPAFTQREYLTLAALVTMAEFGYIGGTERGTTRAMLLHMIILRRCSLEDRGITKVPNNEGQFFLNRFARICIGILTSSVWREAVTSTKAVCDLCDLLDGRLFLTLESVSGLNDGVQETGSTVWSEFKDLSLALKGLCVFGTNFEVRSTGNESLKRESAGKLRQGERSRRAKLQETSGLKTRVLPFSNPVFDVHLRPVQLSIDESAEEFAAARASRTFKELSHCHNPRYPVDHKASAAMTAWQKVKAQRRNDFFMTEMRDYAASLTNAVGGILEPETVFVSSATDRKKASNSGSWASGETLRSSNNPASGPKPTKKNSHKPTKLSVRDTAASFIQEKQREALQKQIKQWNLKRDGFDKETDLVSRYVKTKQYFSSISKGKQGLVEAEILTYLLDTLVRMLLANAGNQAEHSRMAILSFIWDIVWQISKLQDSITADIAACIASVTNTLGLPDVNLQIRGDQKLY